MSTGNSKKYPRQRGVSLVEVMISVVIGLLMVLVIYQVYEVSEGQKRTMTGGSDAEQGASYGLYLLGRDLSVAGSGIASSAAALDQCAMLRPLPVLITAGASDNIPDSMTVLYAGSGSLSTPATFINTATVASLSSATPYQVRAPVGFSPNDVIAAVQGTNCTVSTIDASPPKPTNGVSVSAPPTPGANGVATLTHTPVAGSVGVTYTAGNASVINLGQAASVGRVQYTVDTTTSVLRTQNLFPAAGAVTPVVADVVNLKAQYGLDTNNDGIVDRWQDPTGAVWSAAALVTQPLATLQQIRAIRVVIVTRSPQYDKDVITAGPLSILNGTKSMTLAGEQQHYRYKVLETIVPLRNALWNAS